jgi:HlyD family secretion protein
MRGDTVSAGQVVLKVEPLDVADHVIAYVPVADGKKAAPGMEAQVEPLSVKKEEVGFLLGKVVSVSKYPASKGSMVDLLADPDLVSFFTSSGPTTAVEVLLERDPTNPTGHRWSTGRTGGLTLTQGTVCNVEIVTRQEAPIRMVIPTVRKALGI